MAESAQKNTKRELFKPLSQAPIEHKNSKFNAFLRQLSIFQKCYEGLGETTCCEALWIGVSRIWVQVFFYGNT